MEDARADESLFTTGVLITRDGEITTTDHFESMVDEYAAEMAKRSPGDFTELVGERVEQEVVAEPLAALGAEDPRTVAELCALHDFFEPSSSDGWLSFLPVMRLFRPIETSTDGVPESFVPVPATHVPHLSQVYTPTLVYVWLDDCPPCDEVKSDLEVVFQQPREVMPLAVYGPEDREFLTTEYGVTAGPAVLFMRDGTVESRLYGAHGNRSLEAELDKLTASS